MESKNVEGCDGMEMREGGIERGRGGIERGKGFPLNEGGNLIP